MADPATYPDSLQSVTFPTGEALTAAEQCLAAARVLDEQIGVVSTAAGRATADWRGGHADDFGLVEPDTEQAAADLGGRLRRLAGALRSAAEAAALEDRRRAAARAALDAQRQPGGPQ